MKFLFLFPSLFFCFNSFAQNSGSLVGNPATSRAKIAYVNVDSFEANYQFFKIKSAEFNSRKIQMEAELKNAYDSIQTEVDELQKKAAANNLSQDEYEVAQKRLLQKQQDLELRKQESTDQLTDMQNETNRDIKTRLVSFLEKYNETHHYDCILSYGSGEGAVLFIDKRLDITPEVIDGLNNLDRSKLNSRNK